MCVWGPRCAPDTCPGDFSFATNTEKKNKWETNNYKRYKAHAQDAESTKVAHHRSIICQYRGEIEYGRLVTESSPRRILLDAWNFQLVSKVNCLPWWFVQLSSLLQVLWDLLDWLEAANQKWQRRPSSLKSNSTNGRIRPYSLGRYGNDSSLKVSPVWLNIRYNNTI